MGNESHAVVSQFSDISSSGQTRLMRMAFERQAFGVAAITLTAVPFAIWMYSLGRPFIDLVLWIVVYSVASVVMVYQRRSYVRDAAELPAERMVAKWLPRIHGVALAHGFGLFMLVFLATGDAPFEVLAFMHIVIIAIISMYASHQSPVYSAYKRFFMTSWGGLTLLMPWSFPDSWPFVMPTSVVFIVIICRHANIAHQFFLHQVKLEEDGARLAEQYRQAKDLAERALADKNQFLSTASHDLRQPIHAMGFLIESIAHRNSDEQLVPALRDLKQSVRAITLMFNSLLDLTKIEVGVLQVKLVDLSLDELMGDVATVFSEEARSRGLDFRIRLTHGKGFVRVDQLLLRQSLINLLQNALRYTKHGGVLLAARRRGNDWQVEVWDTGIGIASGEGESIYSPFYRNENAWQIDSAGHGLGLAVVARCAGMMSAKYGFSSKEGHGSRFWIRVAGSVAPMRSAVATIPMSQEDSQERRNSLSGTGLIIDDDPMVCAAWESLLLSWGVSVRAVPSGKAALEALGDGFRPQAVLCDQRLRAGESGIEVLREILARVPEASGAMVSGEYDSIELREAEQEGYIVLRKPLDIGDLYAILSTWLDRNPDTVKLA